MNEKIIEFKNKLQQMLNDKGEDIAIVMHKHPLADSYKGVYDNFYVVELAGHGFNQLFEIFSKGKNEKFYWGKFSQHLTPKRPEKVIN